MYLVLHLCPECTCGNCFAFLPACLPPSFSPSLSPSLPQSLPTSLLSFSFYDPQSPHLLNLVSSSLFHKESMFFGEYTPKRAAAIVVTEWLPSLHNHLWCQCSLLKLGSKALVSKTSCYYKNTHKCTLKHTCKTKLQMWSAVGEETQFNLCLVRFLLLW